MALHSKTECSAIFIVQIINQRKQIIVLRFQYVGGVDHESTEANSITENTITVPHIKRNRLLAERSLFLLILSHSGTVAIALNNTQPIRYPKAVCPVSPAIA